MMKTTQIQTIKTELLLALNGGMNNKQEIYTIVAQKTNTPRPTVRRVASALKKELQQYHTILADTNRIHAAYDCSECHAKRCIKRSDNRCPKCQVILDWSDE
ncbi:MAG: hypothetical protein AABY15_04000 [Nanoarchaeota archaeon]